MPLPLLGPGWRGTATTGSSIPSSCFSKTLFGRQGGGGVRRMMHGRDGYCKVPCLVAASAQPRARTSSREEHSLSNSD